MKFDELLDRFNVEAWFDYASAALFFPEGDEARAEIRRMGEGG